MQATGMAFSSINTPVHDVLLAIVILTIIQKLPETVDGQCNLQLTVE